jgi:hypothetical protein
LKDQEGDGKMIEGGWNSELCANAGCVIKSVETLGYVTRVLFAEHLLVFKSY